MRQFLSIAPVIPVLTIDRVEDAVPLARALGAGGLRVLEVTLRTDAAIDAVRAIHAAVPEALVGVGTITRPDQIELAREAGAAFGVSPGSTPLLLAAARAQSLPFLPGIMTASELMVALEAGFTSLKLFPARAAGGVDFLKSLAGPFPQAKFCPTGGIDAATAPEYLALPNVACVGGTWLATTTLVAQHNWREIERLAREAARR